MKTKSSQGIQAQGRISLSRLYRGILGFDLNLADRFYSQDYYNDIGPDSSFFSKIGDQIYFDAGIRLIGGARVPLITYYKDIVIGDSSAAQSASGTPQGVTSASGTPLNVDFTADGAYPLAYLPAAGSPLFAGPPLISQDDARTFLLGDADVAALRLLTLSSAAAINTTADSLQIQVDNQGAGLNPGQYRSIRILGVPLLAGGYATVDVTVNGQGQVSGLANLQGAEYLSLPEKTPLSGAFYLPLDLFEIDPLLGRSIASASALSAGTPTFTAPLLSLAASSNASTGLTTSRLSSFDRVAVVLGGAGYQRPQASQSGDPLTTDQPATNDNAPYTYTGIPVSLLRDQSAVSLLGHDAAHPATATVHLAGGSIRRIELDQTLYIRTDAAAADGVYSLGLILPDGINPAIAANLSLTPSTVALNNLVEESEFSAEPGAVDTGVYIAESQANQQALVSSDGYKRLQNRVAYTSLDAKGKPFTVYLNSLGRAYASSSDLTNQQIVNGTAPEFSFASHPTSISIAGTKNDLLRGDTLVVWVEAGTPLIPYSSENGNNNYQNYLTAAYGNQVLNYRMAVNGSATNWQVPLGELYRPQNAIISDLQLFNVPDPRTGTERTLLTWAEISIDAIKGLRSDFGSGLSLPATIKTTWINANPASGTIAWSDLTETVVSIPWDTETSVGMGIADLSIAAQTIKLSDGTVLQTPLISWSQSVRTPYQQAVLNDQPTIYLPMAGLAAGVNSINRGTASPSLSTTEASSRGLDFNVPGALAVEQTTAVRNVDGTGVLSTDLGSFNQLVVDLISQIPFDQLPPPPTPDPADPPLPSLPYAIESWVQLQPGSNPGGAGIVAFGQPSAAAVGSATLPQGWLLQSNFQVQRLTYAEAAALGLIETVPAGQQDGLYGWTWSLLADGANTTAMGGNGGTNLYANALSLANLGAGAKIAGVDAFLANYGLTAAQLPGLDNTTANTMAMVPTSSLLLDQFIDTATQQPTSQLNEVALDPATTLLNQGFVNAETAAANANLDIMLNRLWQYQEATGTAKVVFGLDPTPATAQAAAGPDPFSPEDYAGYALGFALWGGPSISVNGSGQIAFDVSKELTITAPAGSDQRDGAWHYVAVSYTPTYTDYTVNGTTIQVPNDHGTASLFIDGQLAASAQASNPYLPFNPNGQALLLSNNVGGAIDHVAIYSEAINALDPNPAPNGLWPKLTATDALAELEALGLPSLPGAPDPGVIPGAVTSHWLARKVNPAAALQATYTSSYRPDDSGSGWAWSQASGLDPILATVPTVPSASQAGSPADAWTLSLSSSAWASLQSNATTSKGFNPSGQELASISVILSDSATNSSTTLQLTAEQVLVGNQTIAALQPRSTDPASRLDPAGPQLHYSVLNAAPALTLLIPRSELTDPASTTAQIQLTFRSQDTARPDNVVVSTVDPLAFRELTLASDFASSGFASGSTLQQVYNSQEALATAAVLEAAPLQLKYIDSGLKFSSEATAAAANDPAATVPAQTFGSSQVAGTYRNASDPTSLERGWIAIAQTVSADATANLAGRVWINYTGQRPVSPTDPGNPVVPVQQAPITWLNALSNSNFNAETPNLPLLNDGKYPSSSGGLLIKADETLGIDANLGQIMVNADLDADGNEELIIAAPNAAGGGCVYIISGAWIASNLNTNPLTLDLANPTAYGPGVVTILQPGASSSNPSNPSKPDRVSFANFGSALAVDPTANKLWIGAPQYVRELPRLADQTELEALVPIGALYSFDYRQPRSTSSLTLIPVVLGAAGELITPGSDGSATRSYWGSQLGSAIAISTQGQLAVSAPGMPAAQEFYGTDELIQQAVSGKSTASKREDWSSLYGANFANKPSDPTQISQLSGMDRSQLAKVDGNNWKPGSDNVKRLRGYIENNQNINIAEPTLLYNQALQTDAVGAVFLLNQAESLATLAAAQPLPQQLWPEDIAGSGGATFYGSNVVNTLGATGFGASLAFADLANLNSGQLLIGAASTAGTGAVLAIDPTPYLAGDPGSAIAEQPNSYMAYQVAFLNLLGANDLDQFGRRIVSLGDVNQDGYEDALITAPNSRDGAGSGYVVFGSDLLPDPKAPVQFIGSVAPGSIGVLQGPAGPRQAPILEEIGFGPDGQSGAGVYGRGDVDGDGYPDVLLGSGGNGSAYLTWGKPYLSAIDNLALEKLSSSNGFLLEGLARTEQGSLRSVGDFNADGYDDFISIQRGPALTTVRLQLGAATQELLSSYPYNFYSFSISNDTEVVPIGDSNGDGCADIALFIDKTYSPGSQGAGSSTGILYGRSSEKLPIGSGFGLLAPERAPMPERNVVGGLTDAAPAFLTVGNTLYTAVKGIGNTDSIWFNQSRDGGSSWDTWTNLTELQPDLRTMAGHGPALAWHDGRLVLGLLNPQGLINLSSWDPTSQNLAQWTTPSQPTIEGQPIRSSQTPQLLSAGTDLNLLWVEASSELRSSLNTDPFNGGSWLPAESLQERLADGSTRPLRSITAPSITGLGAGLVALAVAEDDAASNPGRISRIRLFTNLPDSLRWGEASSFQASGSALATGPRLVETDTGLALTYGTAAKAVVLQRLDLIDLDGTSLDTAGPLEPVIQQTWRPTLLDLSSDHATAPVNVNGTLLLGNVRADAAQNTQIWLNAIAAPEQPDSSIWIDTTLQLPDGNGGWLVRQQAGSDHPVNIGVLDPSWQSASGGLSPWAPSFAEINGVLYSAVRGWSSTDTNKQFYWNRSFDNGRTWSSWQQLPTGMTSDRPPTIAALDGSLYLVYIGQDKAHTLNITKLEDAASNRWATQISVRAGISDASKQTAEFATLINEGNQLALYYVGTDNNLYSTSSTDPSNDGQFKKSTLIRYNNNSGNQTASGPLAAARYNGQTYLAYQGGTVGSKSNTIYITTGSANDTNWTLFSGVPQPGVANHTGVGLTANSKGLVLSYSDVVNGHNVVSLQQGTGSGSNWSFSPYTVLETPEDSRALYDGANSLYARTDSDKVLVSRIDSNANEAINNAWVVPLPPTLVLSPGQTGSTLTPVGDITGDGKADMLITATNVVLKAPTGSTAETPQTGVRLLSGANTSAAFLAQNDNTSTSQTLQLAASLGINSGVAATAITSSAAFAALPQLTVAASTGSQVDQLSSRGDQSQTAFLASGSNAGSLFQLFQGARESQWSQPQPQLWGEASLRASRFGDLNGDGRPDGLAADGLSQLQTVGGELGYGVWSIRPAGDANGNGLDDVLVSLVPKGPAYRPNAGGSPSIIQPVLIDGALFEVDITTNTFSFDQLRAPLNPYTQAEVFDLNSTSSNDYLPPLQAWINPILAFQPGTLTAASIGAASQPTANSSSAPQLVVDELGHDYQLYTTSSSSGSVLANGLWIGYRNADDSWDSSQIPLGGRTISAVTPTAAFYDGRLFVAYADQNGAIHISYTNRLEQQSKPPQWSWADYPVSVNGSAAKTLISPTLVVNHGLLNLIYPGDVTPDIGNYGTAKSGQQILLASSNNPEAGALSSWGSSFDAAANRFSGAASVLQVQTQGQAASTEMPVAATVFQGQTVLAYQPKGVGGVVLATEPLGSAPGGAPAVFGLKTTSLIASGVSLATDQSLLYLGAAKPGSNPYVTWSEAQLTAFAPASNFPADPAAWIEQESHTVGNVPELPSPITVADNNNITILGKGYLFPTFFGLAMRQGTLIGNWIPRDTNLPIQSAVLETTITAPVQQSLAGYSIDGGIDSNGDGFADSLVSDPTDPAKAVNNQYALFGGDWWNLATQVGTTGDDVIVGTALADVIYTLSGADRVQSKGGIDVILTADGDDEVAISDNRFLRIDADSGFDTLLLEGQLNQSYDFRLNVPSPEYFAGTKLKGFELISSLDYGANTLRFDVEAVNAFNANRFLFLNPDASDSIVLSSEFQRNSNFDTKFAGLLWSAFAAGPATVTPSEASPAVIYVLNPEPDNPGWLDAGDNGTDPGITILAPGADLPTAVGSLAAARTAETAIPPIGRTDQGSTTPFGNGLRVTAFSSSADAGFSHFTVWRQNAALSQVVSYATSSLNSRALPGRDHQLAAGIVVFQPGETSKEILVPWIPGALKDSPGSSLSLEVRELSFNSQKDIHVLIDPLPDASSGQRPALSGISLTSADNADRAWISLRADANNQNQDQLRLRIGLRSTASSLAAATIREVAIRDFDPEEFFALPVGTLNDLPIDRDDLGNQQVGVNLQLNLLPSKKEPSVSLLGPDFLPTASIQIVGSNQIRFLQEAPLSSWRTDRGTGQVSFALEAGSLRQSLLRDAQAGSSGSLTAANAFDDDPLTGWRSTEGRTVGDQAVDNPAVPLGGLAWTPTARRDGRSLALLELSVSGQEVTARFEGGVSLALWQASGSAPTAVAVRPQIEVQRLAGYDSDLGFYSVDGITGSVAGLEPGASGYLEQALARSRAEGLLLSADMLPAYGQAQSYQNLALDSQKSYGVLLLQNGSSEVMFSSFAAANPGGLAQMVSLGSGAAGLGMVLGIEDIAVGLAQSDRDFNDVLLKVTGMVVPIL
ncbi:MAG: DUF4114 domain-containing protein [Cyanobacteriota bacterium]